MWSNYLSTLALRRKWCGARNSAVSGWHSGWHWLLLAVNQCATSAVYWTPGDNVVSQSRSAWCVCASNWCGLSLKALLVGDVGKWECLPVHCRRLWDCASAPINRTFPRPMFAAYAYANHLRSFFNKDHTLQGPKQRRSNLFELLKGN